MRETLLALALLAAPMAAHAQSPAGLTKPSAMTFDDEFDRFVGTPDGSVGWMTTYPYGGEAQRALPANGQEAFNADPSVGNDPFSVANGILSITVTRSAPGSNPYNLPYTTGMITTFNSFNQTYGYFETRAKLPPGRGFWSAFWLLPKPPYTSEIDAYEVLSREPTTLYVSTHNLTSSQPAGVIKPVAVADVTAAFHTYGVDWEPDFCTYYMDGAVVAKLGTPPNMNLPMYLIENVTVGSPGSWAGPPDKNTPFPAQLQIDYVRAYASAHTRDISGTAAIRTAVIPQQ
jgi:beta-glucanase (GH16 family)